MRLFTVGDFHGEIDILKINASNWPEQKELAEDDLLVQLGDFGLIWSNPNSPCYKTEQYWLNWLGDKNYTVAFIDGNHENFTLLNEFPFVEKWGGLVREIPTKNKPIYQLLRGEVYTFNDKKVMALGGAESQDKNQRTEHINWWKEERYTKDEEELVIDQVEKYKDEIDIVFSHTCPNSIAVQYFYYLNAKYSGPYSSMNLGIEYFEGKCNCSVGKFFQHLVDIGLKPEQWHYGHFHDDWIYKCPDTYIKYFCHYENKPMEIL
jgi:hypothetical protein